MFRVGQKVVCVNDGPANDPRCTPGGYWIPHYPKRGCVYTVRDIAQCGGLRLVEVVNPVRDFCDGTAESRWRPDRFRPAVERKTDISIFTRMLDGAREMAN